VRRQLRNGDEVDPTTCVYRADLYKLAQEPAQGGGGGLEVEAPRPEGEVELGDAARKDIRVEGERDAECGMDLVVDEAMRASLALSRSSPLFLTDSSSPTAPPPPPAPSTAPRTASPLSLLPTILPALPPLPSASFPSAAPAPPSSFPPYPLRPFEAPSYFTSHPPRSSSLSSASTFTPTATPTPSDLDLDELLSSCSSWPSSPRTPLFDPYSFATLLRRDNYPPVPYPPPSLAPAASVSAAEAHGINPQWTDAACALSSVPALELGALALYSWADEAPLTARPGFGGGGAGGDELGVGERRERDLVVDGCEAHAQAQGKVGDVMLTLPIEPAFSSEWSAAGARRDGS